MKTWENPDMITLNVNETATGGHDTTRWDDYKTNETGENVTFFFPSANGEGKQWSELPPGVG